MMKPSGKTKPASPRNIQLLVTAPMLTRQVLLALRDWEPQQGLKFTLVKRKSFLLLFEVSTASGYQARGLALERLKEKGLDMTPELDLSIV